MRRSIAFLLFLFVPIVAQEIPDQGNLATTEARYTLGKYEIVIKHQRAKQAILEQREDGSAIPFWCAAHLEILTNGKIIDRLDFDSIMPLGWKAGLFLPTKQESPKHFIMTKYGDYDCRTIIITDRGKLFNLGGGSYRILKQRYLVSPRELPDIAGGGEFSVFDLVQNKVLMSVDWQDLCGNIYPQVAGDVGYILKFYTDGTELFAGVVTVNYKSWQVLEHTKYFFRIDFENGKLIDAGFDAKLHKEFVIDYSNLDLNHQCECTRVPKQATASSSHPRFN